MYYPHRPESEPTLITVREVAYDPLHRTRAKRRRRFWQRWLPPISLTLPTMLGIFVVLGFAGAIVLNALLLTQDDEIVYIVLPNEDIAYTSFTNANGISPIFTPEIQFWADEIVAWGKKYHLDPNLIATVMQIESCGDPNAGSSAGAQGLFQVMPFHFTAEEQQLGLMKDIETNATKGLNYLATGLKKANGHVGLALAGYNGGHGMIEWGWARFPAETRRYYYWGTGIYEEAHSGKLTSDRLNEWLAAGGASLCYQASLTQQTLAKR